MAGVSTDRGLDGHHTHVELGFASDTAVATASAPGTGLCEWTGCPRSKDWTHRVVLAPCVCAYI